MSVLTVHLHGFAQSPETCPVLTEILKWIPAEKIEAITYHPEGDFRRTNIKQTLFELEQIAKDRHVRLSIIGYSFGGLLACYFAEMSPELVDRLLLLAPAPDNYARNFQGRPESSWFMPREYVDALLTFSARPKITRPTTLVHGTNDNDAGGSAIWRIKEWVASENFSEVYILPNVDHSLEPWLSNPDFAAGLNVPTLSKLVQQFVSPALNC